MTYPTPSRLTLPCDPYTLGDFHHFGTKVPSRLGHATHLGDDVDVPAGTPIHAIGDGLVVMAQMRHGSSHKRNWGGLVILGHTHKTTGKPFYSVYGHMTDLKVNEGDTVHEGHVLGVIAPGLSPENGWWIHPHLHFAIYHGPWKGVVLPGYKRWREFWRTRVSWWNDPRPFITQYNGK